jgi:hypothetical protein
LNGEGQVTEVQGERLKSWSIRQDGNKRFLDLHLTENVTDLQPVVMTRSPVAKLPITIDLMHLTPGEAVGFESTVTIDYSPEVEGTITQTEGFAPLDAGDGTDRLQTATGGEITLALNRDGASPSPVELTDTSLKGEVHPNGESIQFRFKGTAHVREENVEITILSGNAAVDQVPSHDNYRLRLSTNEDRPVYKLVFPELGTYPVTLSFVAPLTASKANWRGVDFTIAAGAVVPLTLNRLDSELEFHRDQDSVVPLRDNDNWLGFLPATGRARLQWKTSRKTGEGKLFFTTTGRVEAKVGVGLLRQDHEIDYQVLQGELTSLPITGGKTACPFPGRPIAGTAGQRFTAPAT